MILKKVAGWFGYAKAGAREYWYPIVNTLTRSNVRITPEQALRVSTVMACVKVLAETMASLPLHIYRPLAGGGREMDRGHALYNLLHTKPNSWQTSFEFREMLMGHMCLRGNAYSVIVTDSRGQPVKLIPLHPDRVTIERIDEDRLIYIKRHPQTGKETRYNQEDIFHLRGLSSDGVKGISPIQQAADMIGTAIAAEQMESSFYRNGAMLGNVLKHPKALKDKARKNLERSLKEEYSGSDAAFQTLILEEGMEWERLGVVPKEAQFIETKKFKVVDICRTYRIPPHLVQHLEKSTFNNIEHQSLEFVIYTLRPWVKRWEQALKRDLFLEGDPASAKFLLDGLLRGDTKGRSEALQIQFQNGIINQDEWRAIENRNPLPNGQGQKFYVQLNLSSTDKASEDTSTASAWLSDIAGRISNAEIRAIQRGPDSGFGLWLFNFYRSKHKGYVRDALSPYLATVTLSDTEPLISRLTTDYAATLKGKPAAAVCKCLNDGRIDHIEKVVKDYVCEVRNEN